MAGKGLVHEYSPVEKKITISIGYDNQKVDQHFDITSLINQADKALYESKGQGRNTWMRFVEDIKGQ
ncbi:MAG: diguanylate cyclase domain-containing protein [Anaerorhabdus sp.]|uniref:diguanylate cyclase domain-containing protein n=1 Tax=Anaerorhabdus sp. TaxID=1872524 RepID=UPI003A85CD51